MPRFTDVTAFHQFMSRKLDHWKQTVQIEHANLVDEMIDVMKQDLSGTVSTKELARLGHPFGRTRGGRKRGRVRNLPINEQTGKLKRSLSRKRLDLASKITYEVGFTAPYSKYILNPSGTRKMVGRGYWREIEKQYKKRRSEAIRRIRARGLL